MLRLVLVLFLSIITVHSFAGGGMTRGAADTIPLNSKNIPVDSNILVVIDNSLQGTLRQFKNLLSSPESIASMNVLKDSLGKAKYGERGKYGVIEIILKKDATGVKITSVHMEDSYPVSDSIIVRPEIESAFPGGTNSWRSFLVKNLNGATPVDNGAPEGTYTVIVQFIVDKDGNISDLKALTNHGYGMEEEVLKLLKKSPRWEPAIQNGRQVKAYRRQPVTFQVEEDDGKTKKKNKNKDKNKDKD